jgi:hypothetical protein
MYLTELQKYIKSKLTEGEKSKLLENLTPPLSLSNRICRQKNQLESGVVMYACKPCTREAWIGRLLS